MRVVARRLRPPVCLRQRRLSVRCWPEHPAYISCVRALCVCVCVRARAALCVRASPWLCLRRPCDDSACFAAFTSMLSIRAPDGQTSLMFASVFVIVWCGAGIVTVNAQLLGGTLYVAIACIVVVGSSPLSCMPAVLVAFTHACLSRLEIAFAFVCACPPYCAGMCVAGRFSSPSVCLATAYSP